MQHRGMREQLRHSTSDYVGVLCTPVTFWSPPSLPFPEVCVMNTFEAAYRKELRPKIKGGGRWGVIKLLDLDDMMLGQGWI